MQEVGQALFADLATEDNITDVQLWHLKLAHINHEDVANWVKHLKHGPTKDLTTPKKYSVECHDCVRGKIKRTGPGLLGAAGKATRPFERVHIDVSGPMRTRGILGNHYGLFIYDEFTKNGDELPLHKKSDVHKVYRDYCIRVFNETGYKIQNVHSDQGGEFTCASFMAVLEELDQTWSVST